jgi:carbon storage regulator CsrA
MLVLSRRVDEKILLPDLETSIQVVHIRGGVVRLGIEAPPEVRVLREEVKDHGPTPAAHRGLIPAPCAETVPPLTLLQINQLLNKRLAIARQGLNEVHSRLSSGNSEEAASILDKLDEDLHMLQRRLQREVESRPGSTT